MAQLARYDGFVAPAGYNFGPATIAVCQAGGSGGPPCTPLALIYNDPTGTSQIQQPFLADMNGHYHFYAPAGPYVTDTYGSGYTTTLTNITLGSNVPSLSGANTWTGAQTLQGNALTFFKPAQYSSGLFATMSAPLTGNNTGTLPVNFNFQTFGFPNTGDSTRDNTIFRMGWNIANGGGAMVPGEAATLLEMENYYFPTGGTCGSTGASVESHWGYLDNSATIHRLASWCGARDGSHYSISFTIAPTNSDPFIIYGGDSAHIIADIVYSVPAFKLFSNSQTFIAQFRLAGGSQNLFQIGGGAGGSNVSDVQIGTDVDGGAANPYLDISSNSVKIKNLGPASAAFSIKHEEAGSCNLSSGTCTFTYAQAYSSAPFCSATPTTTGTFTTGATLKVNPGTSSVAVSDTTSTDTATVDVVCSGTS